MSLLDTPGLWHRRFSRPFAGLVSLLASANPALGVLGYYHPSAEGGLRLIRDSLIICAERHSQRTMPFC
jgi:hypothetical protein